jgi:hypothetical protein
LVDRIQLLETSSVYNFFNKSDTWGGIDYWTLPPRRKLAGSTSTNTTARKTAGRSGKKSESFPDCPDPLIVVSQDVFRTASRGHTCYTAQEYQTFIKTGKAANSLPGYDFKFNIAYARKLFLRSKSTLGTRDEDVTNTILQEVDNVITEVIPEAPLEMEVDS